MHRRTNTAFVVLLLLAGCGTSTAPAAPKPEKPPLSVTVTTLAEGAALVQGLRLPAVVSAEREVTVVARAAGTVTQVGFDLGDPVQQDAQLISIDEGRDSALRIASQTAVKSKMNAQRSLDDADRSTAAQVRQVELAVGQARAARELAATALRNAQATTDSTIRQAELAADQARTGRAHAEDAADASTEGVRVAVERAENGRDLARETREQKEDAMARSIADLQESARSTLVGTAALAVTLLDSTNLQTGLISGSGITPAYAADLGNQNPATRADAQARMTSAWSAALAYRSRALSGSASDIQDGLTLLGQVRAALDATKVLLEATAPTTALPLSSAQGGPSLTGLRGSVGGAQSQAAGATTQLTGVLQGVRTLQASSDALSDTLDRAVDDAELQLESAQRGEDAATVGAAAQRDAAASGEALASNAVSTARAGAAAQLDAARLQVRLADLQVQNAEAALALARSARTSQLDGIRAQADLAQGQLDLASYQLSTLTVRAPVDGAVTRRFVSVGDTVAPGSPVATLSQTRALKVSFGLDQEDLAGVSVGQPLVVRTQQGVETDASITRISPTADAQTRKFVVEARLGTRTGGIAPGLVVDVDLRVRRTPSRATGTVFLPLQAVAISQNETTVYVVRDGRAAKLPVTIVHVEGEYVEVAVDAPPATQVITAGSPLLAVGSAVQVVAPDAPSSAPAAPQP